MKIDRENSILMLKKIIICSLSLMLLGFGCGINIVTRQGADPITVFYEGLSKTLGISVGLTASVLNFSLILIVLIISFFSAKANNVRNFKEMLGYIFKYISVGTVVYLFVLGTFIDFGIWVYGLWGIPNTFVFQIIGSLLGCLICFIGLGGYMSVDIGIDPWTAFAVILSKKLSKSFRSVKIILDGLTLLSGWLMGGKVGIITLFCAIVGGPVIQKSAELLDKVLPKVLQSNYKRTVKNQ